MPNSRQFVITLCTILFATMLAAPSLAAKALPVSGTIELETPTDLATQASDTPWPMFGDNVTFSITFSGTLSSKVRLFVIMACKQGDTIVYQWSGSTDFAFPLINQDGPQLWWDGGNAECTASLMYQQATGRKTELQILDNTTFEVAAGSL